MKCVAIAAMSRNRVIGRNAGVPWNHPADTRHFFNSTRGCSVVMGRKTFFSLPPAIRPLPERHNIVCSSRALSEHGVTRWSDAYSCLKKVLNEHRHTEGTIWIAGGAQVYAATEVLWDELVLTEVPNLVSGDTFFPPLRRQWQIDHEVSLPQGVQIKYCCPWGAHPDTSVERGF